MSSRDCPPGGGALRSASCPLLSPQPQAPAPPPGGDSARSAKCGGGDGSRSALLPSRRSPRVLGETPTCLPRWHHFQGKTLVARMETRPHPGHTPSSTVHVPRGRECAARGPGALARGASLQAGLPPSSRPREPRKGTRATAASQPRARSGQVWQTCLGQRMGVREGAATGCAPDRYT